MGLTMDVVTATRRAGRWRECVATWKATCSFELHPLFFDTTAGETVMEAYQALYEASEADIIAYFHDDVEINEMGWDQRVLKEFEDPTVGVVGFGGSLAHGSPDLYKVPYHISQLGRTGYLSNVKDAEVHGERFNGSCDVATLDGFSLIVRRSLLGQSGGWPVDRLKFHGYDYWLTCMAHRLGFRVRLVGIGAHHWGGQTSTKLNGMDAEWHRDGHMYIYQEFRDILPFDARRGA